MYLGAFQIYSELVCTVSITDSHIYYITILTARISYLICLRKNNDFKSGGCVWTVRKCGCICAWLHFPMGVTCPRYA